jgi:hypothetical protein
MLTPEDAVRSGALTDTNAFNAVCDNLAREQEANHFLREVMAAAERSLNITRDNLIEDSGHPDLAGSDLRHFAGQVETVGHALRSALAQSST